MSLNPNRAKAAATWSTQATSDSGGVIFRESARGVVGGHDLSRGMSFAISKGIEVVTMMRLQPEVSTPSSSRN